MAISNQDKERLNAIDARTRDIGLGTVIQTAQNDIDTAEADIAALEGYQTDVATDVGLLHHVKIVVAGGAAGNTDKALPTGTWDVVDCYVVMQGAGESSDTVQLLDDSDNAISDAMAASGADHAIVRAASLNDANAEGIVGGTTALRVTTVDADAGSDVAAMEVNVLLRKVA